MSGSGLARPGFRRDIEGMRAIAVVAVIAYHAGVPGFGGGYVGVDVFFVISGFLITGLLAAERAERGRIDLGRFYARRARRLLPASSLVVVATLVGTFAVGGALLREREAITARWVVAFLANHRFASTDTGYFAEGSTPSPYLHFWSLAVEEQFYLLWPGLILLTGLGAAGVVALRRRLSTALVAVMAVSFVAGVLVTERSQITAFYLLPTRAWELAVGAFVAVVAAHPGRRSARVASVAGVAGIVVAVVAFDAATPFPGVAASLPVVATALLIVGGSATDEGAVQRLLALRPLQRIGGYSYSLYLWHWPVLVLVGIAAPRVARSTTLSVAAVVVVAVPLAAASYHLVEDPIRRDRRLTTGRSLALAGGLVVTGFVASAVSVAGLRLDAGRPAALHTASGRGAFVATGYVPDDLRPSLRDAADDLPAMYAVDGCDWDWRTTEAVPCVFGDETSATRVVLFGDSHAGQWSDPLAAVAAQRGWRLETLVTPSCSAMSYPQPRDACGEWRERALGFLEREPPELVVVVDSGFRLFPSDPVAWEAGVRTTLRRLTSVTDVVLLGETSRPSESATDCLADHVDDVRPCEPNAGDPERAALLAAESRIAHDTGAAMADLTPLLCWDDRCPAVVGDVLVYRDASHVTRTFALLRTDELARAVDAALADAAR